MKAAGWSRVRALFLSALQRAPGEREAFLDRECAGERDLRRELASLLAADFEAGDFLEAPAVAGGDEEEAEDANIGRRLGPYRLVRRIGSGGMGSVYLAYRADEEFDQRVAVKLLKRGMDTEEILSRFRAERQILAGLDHPNIARLLDGGTTGDGLPYFVMEHVEGRPIDVHCEEKGLGIPERLALFREVCSAVQQAHRNLVIHRDIKPGNVLVTPGGVPKLLDFGIAKLLDPGAAAVRTRTGLRPMTPAYASPEQVCGGTVTTSSDVYSLGVLLFLLLTGRLPQAEGEGGAEAGGDPAGRQEPPRASAVSPEGERRRLAGDLDNILLKALQADPARRYGSAQELSDDIGRHLDGRPVLARPDSLAYRAGKFIRRHRVGVAAAGAIALIITASAVGLSLQALRIAEERDRAEREAGKATAINSFLLSSMGSADPERGQGKDVTVLEVLDSSAGDIEAAFGGEPEIEASVRFTLGTLYDSLGRYDEAEGQLRTAHALRVRALGESDPEVADALGALAAVREHRGDLAEAERMQREVLAARRSRLGGRHLLVAESLNNLGGVLYLSGRLEEAEALLREAQTLQVSLIGRDDDRVATTMEGLALLLDARGAFEEAGRLHRESLEIRRRLHGEAHPLISVGLTNLATSLYTGGDLDGPLPLLSEALEMDRRLLGQEHPRVARTLVTIAQLHRERGETEASEEAYRRALEVARLRFGERHREVARILDGLGMLSQQKGDLAAAESQYREALAQRRDLLDPQDGDIAESCNNLAGLLHDTGRLAEAERMYREAIGIMTAIYGRRNLNVAMPLANLAILHRDTGRLREAEAELAESLAVLGELVPGTWYEANYRSHYGRCLALLGRHQEAERALLDAQRVLVASFGAEGPRARRTADWLVSLYEKTGSPEKAARLRERSGSG